MTTYRGCNGPTVYVDVDETLVLWTPPPGAVQFPVPGLPFRVWEHRKHTELIQQLHGVGYHVVVWSRGGADWAGRVVEALGLAPYVHVILSKPDLWLDDHQNPADILEPGRRRYIGTPPARIPGSGDNE